MLHKVGWNGERRGEAVNGAWLVVRDRSGSEIEVVR